VIGSIPNDLNQTIYTTQFKSLRLSYDFDLNQSDKGDLWFWLKSIFKRFWCLINNNNWKSWSVICRHLQGVYSTTVFSLCDVTDRWWIKFVLWWIAVACLLIKPKIRIMAVPLRKLRLHALMTMTTGFNENGTDMIRANAVEQGSCADVLQNSRLFKALLPVDHSIAYSPTGTQENRHTDLKLRHRCVIFISKTVWAVLRPALQ